jgi:2-haloacid dehalogenase
MIDFGRKRVLTFDCYGTLIDWETGIVAALAPILAAHGVAADPERLLSLYGEVEAPLEHGPFLPYRRVLMAALRGVGERLGVRPTEAEQARFAASVGDWPAFADTPAALAALQRRFKLAIVSNVDDDLFALSNPKLGVVFDWIVTAQQVGRYKPSLENFRHALARIGAPAGEVLHVAQSLFHDHAPAKQLGLDTVWVNRRGGRAGAGATPRADARFDLEVPDLATLARVAGAARA